MGVPRLSSLLESALSQGGSQQKLALTLTVGTVMGLMPLLWGSCLLCLCIGWRWRLNHPLIQLLNYSLYPVQIGLFVPFLCAGNWLFGQAVPLDETLIECFMQEPLSVFNQLWLANLQGLFVWGVVSLLLSPLLYFVFSVFLRRFKNEDRRLEHQLKRSLIHRV